MADFEVTNPEGKKFIVTAPEGATQDQVLAYAQANYGKLSAAAQRVAGDAITQGALDPTQGMGFTERFNAGMGKAITDIGRGAMQLVGQGPSAQETEETRRLDAPLMSTAGGLTGNIGGNLALMAPAMVLPGAASVPAAGAIGASLGALQPTGGALERLKNMGLGFGLGAGSQWAGTTGATLLGERAARNQAAAETAKVQGAVRDQALTQGRQAGYAVPPSTVNPSLFNIGVESLGGKIATQQQASVANQGITDTLGRRAIGLQPNAPLTEQIVGKMRAAEGKAYQEIKNVDASASGGKFNWDPQFVNDTKAIGQDLSIAAQEFPSSTRNAAIENLNKDLSIGAWSPTAIIEKVKLLRSDASSNFKAFADPEKLALARAQRQAADALDGLMERRLADIGRQDLSQAYQASRINIAKLHDVEAALTPGGHLDARVLSKIGENGRLSGELKTIADFAGNFPKAVQTGEKVGSPFIPTLRSTLSAGFGGAMGGLPGVAAGYGAGVALPWAARGAMLSGPGQSVMARPNYSPGLLANMNRANLLPSPETAGLLSRTAIPSIYMGMNQ